MDTHTYSTPPMENLRASASAGNYETYGVSGATITESNTYLLSDLIALETPATGIKLKCNIQQSKVTYNSQTQAYSEEITDVNGGTKAVRWYYTRDGQNVLFLGQTTLTCTVADDTDEADIAITPVMPNATHFRLMISGSGSKFYYDYADVPRDRAGTNTFLVAADLDIYTSYFLSDEGEYKNIGHEDGLAEADPPMLTSMPDSVWRVDGLTDDGYQWHKLLPDVTRYKMDPLERDHVIRVYDISEPQEGFRHNGLAILDPISCTSYHDKDRWDIELVHPLDDWGKWKFLLVQNILKIDGQLFRIYAQEPYIGPSGGSMKINAKHISGDMADDLIEHGIFNGGTGQQFINWAFNAKVHWNPLDYYHKPYDFTGYSDCDEIAGVDEYENVTLWGAIAGVDNCMINRFCGEIYRDNFYFSVCKRMQFAKDDAFYLRYSLDMVEIRQKVDYTDFCTNLNCYDNFGNFFAVSYTPTSAWAVHHAKRRMMKFNYDRFEGSMERLAADAMAYWNQVCAPKVTYELKIANLMHDPRYADFLDLQNYSYGDRGTIYCPELDISTVQQITAVEKNEITGDIISMTLGNLSASLCRPSYMGSTVSSGHDPQDRTMDMLQSELKDMNLRLLSTWRGAASYKWRDLKKYTWKEVKKYGNKDT